MKRRFMINFFKGLLFVLLLFAGLKISVKLLYPSNLIVRIWDGFYSLKRESLDLLVTGSSHAFSTFDPSIILEETGMENYILASHSQNPVQTYYNVKEALHYQHPKAIIMEAFMIDNSNNWRDGATYDRDWRKESNIDSMRFGPTKLEAVMEQYEKANWSYALLPLARCHDNWADIKNICSNLNFYTKGIRDFSPFSPSLTSMSAETMEKYAQADYNPSEWVISPTNELHFRKLAQLCREEDITLYLVMAPMYDVYIRSINYDSRNSQLAALAESEGVYYLDCNLRYDEIGLTAQDFEDEFISFIHLNSTGAEKVTRFVMKELWGQEKNSFGGTN